MSVDIGVRTGVDSFHAETAYIVSQDTPERWNREQLSLRRIPVRILPPQPPVLRKYSISDGLTP